MSEAARSQRTDQRVEPFMDPPAAATSQGGNPLAELARVVGQDDPFRNMFRQGKSTVRPPVEPVPTYAPAATPSYSGGGAEEHVVEETDRSAEEEGHPLGLRPSNHDPEEWHHASGEAGHWDDGYDPRRDQGDHHGQDETWRDPSAEMPIESPDYVAPPLTPDLWAEQGAEAEHDGTAPVALSDEDAADRKTPRRPLVVLLAVLALTGGGLAATFLSRSGSTAVVYNGATPTIMAASGPTKIKQTDATAETTPEDADAALLNKNGASGGGPVRVVNSQEQPIDLNQLPKAAGSQPDAPASDTPSPFLVPKKVKTFLVHPDGSLVNPSATHVASAPAVPQLAVGAMSGNDGADAVPAATPRPSTPKSTSHAATTPKAPPTSIADVATPETADAGAAKPPASAGAASGADSKPAQAADAADTAETPATGGNFSLQLAASPSEQDARGAFTKLKKKYSELGGYQPTVVKKVDNGQKTVYRLRVGNLSQDQAKTLCSKLQASGGSCFVVRN